MKQAISTRLSVIKDFFKVSFPEVKKVDLLRWGFVVGGFTILATVMALMLFRWSFDLGDGSTFFQFAHNLAHGEVIYRDFIHFRTPGSYFLQSLSIRLFGDNASSVTFALQLEAHTLYIFVFGLALAIFLRFKRVLLGVAVLTGAALLPGYLQLRTALAFLAVVLYIQARRSGRYRSIWLVISGIVAGLAFTFGQEAAVMAGATIMAAELCAMRRNTWKLGIKNLSLVAIGGLVGLLPLLSYVLLMSSVQNFLYYTLYYAFVLQPRGMNVPYPVLSYENILYYIVPSILILCFYVFYSAKEIGVSTAIIFAFAIARLATLFGRSDIGHLIFVLPEIILLVFLALTTVNKARFNKTTLYRFLPYGAGLAFSLYMAMTFGSTWVVLGAVVILVAFTLRRPVMSGRITQWSTIVLAVLSAMTAVLGYLLYPEYYVAVRSLSKQEVTAQSIGGVNVNKKVFDEVNNVKTAVAKYHPTTIFSYPIQPFYYTLAEKHATRFMTFEPQTTEHEQDAAISDLKRTKPEVVVMDPAQAALMSKSLWKINNYITMHYETAEVVKSDRILWIMVPRTPTLRDNLALSVYRSNDVKLGKVNDIQSPEKGIFNGIMVAPGQSADFIVDHSERSSRLQLSIFQNDVEAVADCVDVTMIGKMTSKTTACSVDKTVMLPLVDNTRTVRFTNNSKLPVVINDPTFVPSL